MGVRPQRTGLNRSLLVFSCVHHFSRPDGATGDVESVVDWRFRNGRAVSLHEIADTMAFAQIAGLTPQAA